MVELSCHYLSIQDKQSLEVSFTAFYKVCGGTVDQCGRVRLLRALHESSWPLCSIQAQLVIQMVRPEAQWGREKEVSHFLQGPAPRPCCSSQLLAKHQPAEWVVIYSQSHLFLQLPAWTHSWDWQLLHLQAAPWAGQLGVNGIV